MTRAVAVVIVSGLAAAWAVAGCGGKKRQQRAGDAAPVELITAPSVPDGGAALEATEEVEPNDSADLASPLPLGATARGKIDSDDVDYYRIEISEAGALAVLTSAVDADLSIEIEDGNGATVARSDRGAARIREGVPNLPVAPGRYTVIVKRKAPPAPKRRKGRKPPPPKVAPAVSYELSAQLAAPAPNAEREPDDDRGTANDLIAGDAASGFLGWTGDVDVWKLSVELLSAKNAIDIEVDAVEGVALSLELADGVGAPLLARKAPRGKPLVVRGVVPVVPSGGPPFHYLTIKGDRSNPETAYQLRVTAKPIEPDAEIEPNDAPDQAMAFPADRTRVDGVWTAGDVDCYAFAPVAEPRTLDLTVTPADLDLSIELFVGGTSVGKGELAGKGTVEKVSGAVPGGARAVLCVRGGKGADGEGTYELSMREGPASEP